jgi:hypothetical protein
MYIFDILIVSINPSRNAGHEKTELKKKKTSKERDRKRPYMMIFEKKTTGGLLTYTTLSHDDYRQVVLLELSY